MSVRGAGSETADAEKGKDVGQVRAVARATRIVATLAEHPFPLGIVELAQFVQLSPASVHRILMTLVQVGWVEQNTRTAKYRLGIQPIGLGSVGLVSNPVLHDARMFLSRLAEWSGHDAVLSTLVGLKSVQLTRVAGAHTEFIEFEPGHPQLAHAMADGKLLLSYMPAEHRSRLYETGELRAFTPNTITDPVEIERELASIQERGYAIDNFERFSAGRGIAAPVMDGDGRPIAAMLCLGRIDPALDAEIIRQLLELTREMSERLRGAGDLPASALDIAEPGSTGTEPQQLS